MVLVRIEGGQSFASARSTDSRAHRIAHSRNELVVLALWDHEYR
tara:strand:+ start:153 stop:284 length:132 start_codon:yes stop_codon:yes gene_type:complete